MKVDTYGLDFIKRMEGLRLKAYVCPAGVLTIGYGHTGPDVAKGMEITEERADELLREDVARFEACINSEVKVPLTQNQFNALVSWAFNVGCDAVQKSTLVRLLNWGQYDSVPSELRRWVYSKGFVMPGLVRRREAEVGLWGTPDGSEAA